MDMSIDLHLRSNTDEEFLLASKVEHVLHFFSVVVGSVKFYYLLEFGSVDSETHRTIEIL